GGGSGCLPRSPGDDDGPKVTNDVRRDNIFGHLEYEPANNVTLVGQVLMARNKTRQQRQSANVRRPWRPTVSLDDALPAGSVAAQMLAENRTSITFQKEAGPDLLQNAQFDVINETTSLTAGFDINLETGGFLDGWNLNGYYQYGKNRQENIFYGSAHWQHII